MNVIINENERVDDVQINGLQIIQNTKGFCFGIDAVLLANFAKCKNNSKGVDLGTGTGIIPLIIAGKSNVGHIYAVEIQDEVAEMAKRSIELNDINDKISVIKGDIKNIKNLLDGYCFDFVTSNPPYMNPNGIGNQSETVRISKQEVLCNLEDIFKAAAYLLKQGGCFYMVHRPNRIVEISQYTQKYSLELKEVRFIHPSVDKAPNLALYKFVKNGKPDLKVLAPLYVYDENGNYTDEINMIYNSEKIGVV